MGIVDDGKSKRAPIWPGMPTRRSQMFEFFLGFFPTWIGLIGITLVLLMPLVQSCRNALGDAGQPAAAEKQ